MVAERILEIVKSYQPACILAAAAELDVFSVLRGEPLAAAAVAARIQGDLRATEILLDALAAFGLLSKDEGRYSLPEELGSALGGHGPGSVLAMVQHQANCLRRWAQLARVVKTGRPAEREPSVRGEDADRAAFIGAMDNLAAPVAGEVIRALDGIEFKHLLDVGGASGSWTIAFLRSRPAARATIFDLPPVMAMAERRLSEAGVAERVRLVPGDFYADSMPMGADLAWVSAIVHQNSRAQNRALFAKIREGLEPGGRIAIRDIIMEPCRTRPVGGAFFAVNMLVGTEGGGTFTLEEIREDLEASGFRDVLLARTDPWMSSVVVASKPR